MFRCCFRSPLCQLRSFLAVPESYFTSMLLHPFFRSHRAGVPFQPLLFLNERFSEIPPDVVHESLCSLADVLLRTPRDVLAQVGVSRVPRISTKEKRRPQA